MNTRGRPEGYGYIVKHRLTKLVVFLLLGAIVNVAVAWGCAGWIDLTGVVPRGTSPRKYSRYHWQVFDYFERIGASRMGWRVPPIIITGDGQTNMDSYMESLPQEFEPPLPLGRISDRRGWPLLSMQCAFVETAQDIWNPVYEVDDGIKLTTTPGSDERGLRALPLRPIWTGFAINTVFYAAILWLLTLGPFTARRMIRQRRGHCIKCGYDLRGHFSAGCPECGWRREAEA